MNRVTSFIACMGVAVGLGVACNLSSTSPSTENVAKTSAPVSGAGFTSTNTAVDGTGHCKNGNEDVNCNIYDGKPYVWLNGGPPTAYVGDGTYFFAVLSPGGQSNPNDGAPNNLSDDFDAYTNRTFTVAGSAISNYGGSHDFANNKIRLMPYADTTNPGGVYIMAICSLGGGYPVDPSKCKYDAFKVATGAEEQKSDLVVSKTAIATFSRSYKWTISKDVDKTHVDQVGGNATFNYEVDVEHDDGTDGGWTVSGKITVQNFNDFAVPNVDVTDAINDANATCTVTNGIGLTVAANDAVTVDYSCTYSQAPASKSEQNTATATWPSGYTPGTSDSFTLDFAFPTNPGTLVDDCVDVTDDFNGDVSKLGTVCVGDANPTAFKYSRVIAVPQYGCLEYPNTATFKTNTNGTTGSASQEVTVCGPIHTGALTMGFWQNRNGQGIILTGASTGGVCNSGTWLEQLAPFQDLSSTASCNQVASYVYNVVKAANASGASMNAMLKAQMLATALDVYFSDPALGGNKIGAPSPIGPVTIDLTTICANAASCTTFEDASAAFGGATSLTVMQMLTYAASQSNAGGSVWYGNVKPTQELAKDAFDAINNQVAFAP